MNPASLSLLGMAEFYREKSKVESRKHEEKPEKQEIETWTHQRSSAVGNWVEGGGARARCATRVWLSVLRSATLLLWATLLRT
jgi:hypothetical protein